MKKEQQRKILHNLRVSLSQAIAFAHTLSIEMPRDFDLTKPFNILGKELQDYQDIVLYLLGEKEKLCSDEEWVHKPLIIGMIGTKKIRKYFKIKTHGLTDHIVDVNNKVGEQGK